MQSDIRRETSPAAYLTMTMRRWMVAMASIGIFLGGLLLKRRSDYFRARAIEFAEAEKGCADSAVYFAGLAKELAEKPDGLMDLVFRLGTSMNRGRSSRAAFDAARAHAHAKECA